ncbi:uncharacterized protein METZ01_LOCUS74086 [marine metagenome]|uniref:Uncharacterized protein n=1 Tax=marine metagenome TaxID=408172 RepID=A0A381TZ26_9ZZZZ
MLTFLWSFSQALAEERVRGRRSLVLENHQARLVLDIAGGSIPEFRFRDSELNPLNWGRRNPGDQPGSMGHFLCCDRWGPPSDAEGKNGMPYHGESSKVVWRVLQDTETTAAGIHARMAADLPLAGLTVDRSVTLAASSPFFVVSETITNNNKLGRIFNIVQHPTIGPPFLDENCVVDSNCRRGFAQGGLMPNPEQPEFLWPSAITKDGERISMRRMTNSEEPSVTSFVIDEELGWAIASNGKRGLLFGYAWKRSDYPWFNHWWKLKDGKPNARGLEFGSTGLHQPFPVLVKKREIFGQQLFEHLDTGKNTTKSYASFLAKIPEDFKGVGKVAIQGGSLVITERAEMRPRKINIATGGLIQ